ncbi:LytR C-terminal domain-containing protein [Solicola gregarius]|uniref:LytR C-terminal domain-containing protein n=1 Tax=Solicola gregarius TaxID=2908642 RepID=A0AA46YMN2_9ACTN|nr:LytR C-terminal domain-containing protein [Solicola gregarius]UYM06794.1 LytR C-terminal domain-containing protein [Solicola gregarius]
MMNQRDSAVRLPSWLIAASLVAVVIATLTYFITTNNDNTDEASPQSEPTQTSDAPESDSPPDDEKTDDGQRATGDSDGPAEKAKPDEQQAKQDAEPEKKQQKPEKKKQPQPEVAPDATVDVYNNSGITNLAASASGDVQSAGFVVGGVDNWYGAIPSTTVYYPPGMEEQAKLLADTLGVGRMLPAVAPMSGDRLSLILTAAI